MTDWLSILKAWLHDPPSKALGVRDHETRARLLIEALLGPGSFTEHEVETTGSESHEADVRAAISERIPLPNARGDGARAVGRHDGLRFYHPLSGAERRLDVESLRGDQEIDVALEIRRAVGDDARRLFLACWRMFAEKLAERSSIWLSLPADTRQPDHALWHHADVAAAFQLDRDFAFLSFSLGPVQTFITGARTLRDLASGSLLLSHLTFSAMLPLLEELGPQSFIYPSCRGVPAVDAWLSQRIGLPPAIVTPPTVEKRLIPALPNRFVALVPHIDAERLARQVEGGAHGEWLAIAAAVRNELAKRWSSTPGWDVRWTNQIESYFEIRTSILPRGALNRELREALLEPPFFEAARSIESLADAIPPDHRRVQGVTAPSWAMDTALAAKIAAASREVADFGSSFVEGEAPTKCTMLGDLEVMGPSAFEASAAFWETAAEEGVRLRGFRIRPQERLSAIALVKRFWIPAFLAPAWEFDPGVTSLSDTATVAARGWLHEAGVDVGTIRADLKGSDVPWSGQWLFSQAWDEPSSFGPEDPSDGDAPPAWVQQRLRQAREKVDREPPRYYAVLHFDGDHLGKWLRGELTPPIRELLHPKMRSYFDGLPDRDEVRKALEARRSLGPALHALLSQALLLFSTQDVPRIVRDHRGELVYAGGDDVVALISCEEALACARELRLAYNADFDGHGHPRMGHRASASAGIAVAHHKASLRAALDSARHAEKSAKNAGRDALGLAVLRRSGEQVEVVIPWGEEACLVRNVDRLVEVFRGGATDRWAYRLRAVSNSLPDNDSFLAEMSRLLDRADLSKAARTELAELSTTLVIPYLAEMTKRAPKLDPREQVAILIQSASFLARGGDHR